MSGWFLLASAIVQYQRKIKLLNLKKKRMQLLTRNVLYGLLLGVSAVKKSVLEGNINRELKIISAIEKCLLESVYYIKVL